MTTILKHSVKIKAIYLKKYILINNYIKDYGIIVGKKNIKGKYVYIIEFKDSIRIWMLPEELETIKLN